MTEQAEAQTDGAQLPEGALPQATETIPEGEQQEQPKAKASYAERVDLSGLPEEIRNPVEARFAHMSSLMRKQETKYSGEISQWRELAAEQAKAIEELRSGVGMVVDHLQDGSLKDAESKIRHDMKIAHEAGDTEGFIAANERLAEIKAKKIALENQKKATKAEPKQETKSQRVSATELSEGAFGDGEITEQDKTALNAWIGETDEYGVPTRPWLTGDAERDPSVRRALIEAYAVFDPSSPWANKSIMEKLGEIDRRMGVTKRSGGQQVMGGQLTMPRKSAKLTLNANQERLAVRTKFGGPKAKSDAEHIEAYRKQLETVKGSRK
jgi:hypothetical protein